MHHIDQPSSQLGILIVKLLKLLLHYFELKLRLVFPLLELFKLDGEFALLFTQSLDFIVPVLNHEQEVFSLCADGFDLKLHVLVVFEQAGNIIFAGAELVFARFGV